MSCQILGFLPGYMFCNGQLKSTGAAIAPSQHVCTKTGEVIYYVRPMFDHGPTVGLYVRRQGIIEAVG